MRSKHIVIMAGGVGSRLYPLSTPEHPKQFLDLLGAGKSLIRLTYERFLVCCPDAHFWVMTGETYRHFIEEQLPEIPEEQVLCEPIGRNTAPCLSYACRKIAAKYPDADIVVTPADAYVPDSAAFAETIMSALDFVAEKESIICVGILPDRPETEYGYICAGAADPDHVVKVKNFKEKPSLVVAQQYLSEGGYFWNAGIFIWRADTFLKEIRKYAPGLESIMDRIEPSFYTAGEKEALEADFPKCEKISIDYALMEKSELVYMVPGCWVWNDLGSFAAIEAVTGKNPLA